MPLLGSNMLIRMALLSLIQYVTICCICFKKIKIRIHGREDLV